MTPLGETHDNTSTSRRRTYVSKVVNDDTSTSRRRKAVKGKDGGVGVGGGKDVENAPMKTPKRTPGSKSRSIRA